MFRRCRILLPLLTAGTLLAAAGCGRNDADVNQLLDSAMREISAGRPEAALELAQSAARRAPKRADALTLEAVLLEKSGRLPEARAAALRAVEAAPDDFAAQYTLGRIDSLDRAHWPDALVALGKAIHLRPGDRNTLILLSNVNLKLSPPQALKYLVALGQDRQTRQSPEYQNQLGICLLRQRSYRRAAEAFLAACKARPEEPTLLYNYALVMDRHFNAGGKVAPLYQRYLDLAPATPETANSRRIAAARLRAIRGR